MTDVTNKMILDGYKSLSDKIDNLHSRLDVCEKIQGIHKKRIDDLRENQDGFMEVLDYCTETVKKMDKGVDEINENINCANERIDEIVQIIEDQEDEEVEEDDLDENRSLNKVHHFLKEILVLHAKLCKEFKNARSNPM